MAKLVQAAVSAQRVSPNRHQRMGHSGSRRITPSSEHRFLSCRKKMDLPNTHECQKWGGFIVNSHATKTNPHPRFQNTLKSEKRRNKAMLASLKKR